MSGLAGLSSDLRQSRSDWPKGQGHVIIFLICTGVAVLAFARSVINLFRDRFPHPADIATVSIFYYGVPLAVAAYFDINLDQMAFLAEFAADPGLAELSIRFVAVALTMLHFGRFLGGRAGKAKLTRFAAINVFAFERVRFILIGLILLIVAGIYLFGIQEFLAGYATEGSETTGLTGNALIYAAIEFLGLTIGYALVLGFAVGKIPFKVIIATGMTILILILLIRAKRLEIVSAFIPLAVVLLSRRASLSSAAWRIIGGGLAVFILVVVSAMRLDSALDYKLGVLLFFSEGLYAGHSLPGIVERLQIHTLDYEYGMRFVNAITAFVPRFLWEGKDDMVYAGNIILKGVAPQGATSFLAEIVLQGGYMAIVICYTLMGFLFERISRFQKGWDQFLAEGVLPARFGAYIISVAIFIPHFRDGIIPAVKLSLQAGLLFMAISGAAWFPKRGAAKVALPET
jgi:hypothetical protein